MSDTATADDKKDPAKADSYDMKVTVKQKYGNGFLKPVENVPAFRTVIDGKMVFYTMPGADNAHAPKGSEIIDKDGVVWVVTQNKPGRFNHLNYVEKK